MFRSHFFLATQPQTQAKLRGVFKIKLCYFQSGATIQCYLWKNDQCECLETKI